MAEEARRRQGCQGMMMSILLETASAHQSCSMIFAGSLIILSLPRWQISSLRPPSVAGSPRCDFPR
jgi:hypothetical protein